MILNFKSNHKAGRSKQINQVAFAHFCIYIYIYSVTTVARCFNRISYNRNHDAYNILDT